MGEMEFFKINFMDRDEKKKALKTRGMVLNMEMTCGTNLLFNECPQVACKIHCHIRKNKYPLTFRSM